MTYIPSILQEMAMQRALAEETERTDAIARANDAYNGVFPKPLIAEPGGPPENSNIIVNRIRPMVTASVHFLFGTPPKISLPRDSALCDPAAAPATDTRPQGMPAAMPEMQGMTAMQGQGRGAMPTMDMQEPDDPEDLMDGGADEAAEEVLEDPKDPREVWLLECLRVNRFEQFLLDLGINGANAGTPYYRVDNYDRYPNDEEPTRPYPRFYVTDPASMRILWDPADLTKTTGYIWQFGAPDPVTKKPRQQRQVIGRQDDGTWLITDQHLDEASGKWITDGETPWPFEWAPIDHCKNLPSPNQVYGEPDVTDVLIGGNKALNFSFSNSAKIEKHHGHPLVYIEGGTDNPFTRILSAIGRVIGIPAGSKIGQLVPQAQWEAASALRREVYEAMLEESSTPSIIIGRDNNDGNPSGVALRVKLWPLIMKTEVKRILYGPLIVELCRRLLELGGFGSNCIVTLDWPELVPTNPLEERQVALLDEQLGASRDTVLAKLGYQADKEREKRAAETAAATPPQLAGNQAATQPGMPQNPMPAGQMQGNRIPAANPNNMGQMGARVP